MPDDIVLNKAEIIERCVARVRAEHAALAGSLAGDILRQDSILLNLQRACEATIDLGMHLVRVQRLGIPQQSRDAFSLLTRHGGLDPALADALQRMVGFRNVAVHDYRRIDLAIVESIVARELDALLAFTAWAITQHA